MALQYINIETPEIALFVLKTLYKNKDNQAYIDHIIDIYKKNIVKYYNIVIESKKQSIYKNESEKELDKILSFLQIILPFCGKFKFT
jgi:hypothetical protein